MMRAVLFSKDLLEHELVGIREQRMWAVDQILESQDGSTRRRDFCKLAEHLGKQILELQEMVKIAPSESFDTKKVIGFVCKKAV